MGGNPLPVSYNQPGDIALRAGMSAADTGNCFGDGSNGTNDLNQSFVSVARLSVSLPRWNQCHANDESSRVR
jgi:hypothetical protein